MTVDFDGLRTSIIYEFNALTRMVENSPTRENQYGEKQILIDPENLDEKLGCLRNEIVTLAAIINPKSGKSLLDGESAVKIEEVDLVPEDYYED